MSSDTKRKRETYTAPGHTHSKKPKARDVEGLSIVCKKPTTFTDPVALLASLTPQSSTGGEEEKTNPLEVALFRAHDPDNSLHARMQDALKTTKPYNIGWNQYVKEGHRMPEDLSVYDLLRLDINSPEGRRVDILRKSLPGAEKGMVHAYETKLHSVAVDLLDPLLRVMSSDSYRLWPNRVNIVRGSGKEDGRPTAHIEGVRDELTFGFIFNPSTTPRPFVYYENTSRNADVEAYYKNHNTRGSNFVMPDSPFRSKFQRVLVWIPPFECLVWNHAVMHEVPTSEFIGNNILVGLYISPYDPEKEDKRADAVDKLLEGCSTYDQAKKIAKKHPGMQIPMRLQTDARKRANSQIAGLSNRNGAIVAGLCGKPGSFWPSGKPSFQHHHPMSASANHPKYKPNMFDAYGRFRPLYDNANPVFSDASLQEPGSLEVLQQELRLKFPGIPEEAYAPEIFRAWHVDPRSLSYVVSLRRGYLGDNPVAEV